MATQLSPPQGGTQRPKYNTRSSIRHSLNLASMGRALADVMHKDAKDSGAEKDKTNKKASSKRLSAINLTQTQARAPTENAPPSLKKKGKDAIPESKTITRTTKRMSVIKTDAASSGEQSDLTSGGASVSPQTTSARSRLSTLRPRTAAVSSALPKYRPKSTIADSASAATKKPTSPQRVGTRKRISSSTDDPSDEDEDRGSSVMELDAKEKRGRPISPLPQRAALKVNLTAAINVRATTPVQKVKSPSQSPSPSPRHGSSARPTKAVKTSTTTSAARSYIARPPSSTSSSASPRTPTLAPSVPKKTPLSQSQKTTPSSTSSHARTTIPSPPDSPLSARSARKTASQLQPPSQRDKVAAPSTPVIVTEDSQDSIELDDVEFLLGSASSPSAPTPVIPRIRTMGIRGGRPALTPTRSPFLPSRSNLSYLSPAPPSIDNSPFLRPKGISPSNDRGSILSWEQLAQHHKSFGDEDIEHLLSEVPAPFRSGAVSPILEPPDSPSLSSLPSPTAYGSISQVLLPDVTPSPAPHNSTLLFDSGPSEFADAASSTLLRLQLAAAENRAQQRLAQIEELETQLHEAKEARMRDAQELAAQIAQLEQRVHENLRVDEQRLNAICSLEDEQRQNQALREQAVQKAVMRTQEAGRISLAAALQAQQDKWEVSCAAETTRSAWMTVRETAEGELELVRSNRDMLAVLLASLNQVQYQLSC